MIVDYIFLIVNATFWGTLGATEGFKWTNSPKLVTITNYHIFRLFTNISFLSTVFLASIVFAGMSYPDICLAMLTILLATWPIYEFSLNYVNHGKFLTQKDKFLFGSLTFRHPPVWMLPILWILGLISYFLSC